VTSPASFLDRTLRLIKEELTDGVEDATILDALSSTLILIRSDEPTAISHSGQTAIVTSSLLIARSGLSVWIDVPDVELKTLQPPLRGLHLASALEQFSRDSGGLLHISIGQPEETPILVLTLRDGFVGDASRELGIRYGRWWGGFGHTGACPDINEPFGAMVSAAAAASEAFKHAMRSLGTFARNPGMFERQFAPFSECTLSVASEDTELVRNVHEIDIVSSGAVSNAALFALLRVPSANGTLRVIEPQDYDETNHNRCMLMTSASPGQPKALDIAQFRTETLNIVPIVSTFQEAVQSETLASVAPRVIVGVDDIPTRWDVQLAGPSWLSIGATTHWSAMASLHVPDGACARCLHPRDSDDGAAHAPTVSFVSFWAGLWAAAYIMRSFGNDAASPESVFLTPTCLRTTSDMWKSALHKNRLCPTHGKP
jgi:ThiF family